MNTTHPISHENAIELLPWLVNESLGASELEQVRAHARSCVVCRRELESLSRLQEIVVEGSVAEAIPSPDMRGINARIDHLIEKQSWMSRLLSRAGTHFGGPWKLAFVAQTMLVLGLATVLLWPSEPEPEFTTLTQPDAISGGHHVRVVFTPEVTIAEATDLLNALGLAIEGGPSARGVYTLAFPDGLSSQEREHILGQLQSMPVVQFAQNVVHR